LFLERVLIALLVRGFHIFDTFGKSFDPESQDRRAQYRTEQGRMCDKLSMISSSLSLRADGLSNVEGSYSSPPPNPKPS
jgi:hypothetical protein